MENKDFETVWTDMISGRVYDAACPELIEMLKQTRKALWKFNNLDPEDLDGQREILKSLLGRYGEDFHFNQPFRCDYGRNISIGERFFANFNLTILDEAPVTIGDDAFIGPNVSIYTACHPNVWIGGWVTIVPGVTIGDRVVIGAGSVVTKDIPSDCVAAGNPARIIKKL